MCIACIGTMHQVGMPSHGALQECYALPLEDINARQMLEEGRDILRKLDRRLPPPPPHLYDTTAAVSALEHLDADAPLISVLAVEHADGHVDDEGEEHGSSPGTAA